MSGFLLRLLLCVLVACLYGINYVSAEEEEEEDWEDYVTPPTQGRKALFRRRLQQIASAKEHKDRVLARMVLLGTHVVVQPAFTEYGWGLTRVPQDVLDLLLETLHHKKPWTDLEEDVEMCQDMGLLFEQVPYLVRSASVNFHVLKQLRHWHEQWLGEETNSLVPTTAYGMRVYRNHSRLLMHMDNPLSHIVSSVLHVGHDENSEPWPLVLEDYNGNTVMIYMEPGDLLLYESAKVLHGRPMPFVGEWYASLFLHYIPKGVNTANNQQQMEEAAAHMTEEEEETEANDLPPLEMYGMGMFEPSCPNLWCGTVSDKVVEIHGPGEVGVIRSTSDYNHSQKIKTEKKPAATEGEL